MYAYAQTESVSCVFLSASVCILEGWHRESFWWQPQKQRLQTWVISLSMEQSFPSFLLAQRSQPAHLSPSICHFSVRLFPQQHFTPPPPVSFCSLLVLRDLFSSPTNGWSPFDEPIMGVLLINTRIGISPLSWIHICKFLGCVFRWPLEPFLTGGERKQR